MTSTLPTQEQVDRIARRLAPDVVRIRLNVGKDWTEDPAIYFRVTLSDDASRRERLAEVTELVKENVAGQLDLAGLEHIPYFRFRSRSEQSKLNEAAWG